jgi:HD-GYP domain-containing protein (c-di-GMP phosphodiesterase class II)
MSSGPLSDAHSPGPDATAKEVLAAELIRERGAPLLDALEERLPGAKDHAEGTAAWAVAIAAELGLAREHALSVRAMAHLHEVGKLYVDARLAAKPIEELTRDETVELERYAEAGGHLAGDAGIPERPCDWLRHLRERYDGHGHPDGLSAERIPLESRIMRTACAFDTLLEIARTDEPDSRTRRLRALEELRSVAGTQLDPATVEALERTLSRAAPD